MLCRWLAQIDLILSPRGARHVSEAVVRMVGMLIAGCVLLTVRPREDSKKNSRTSLLLHLHSKDQYAEVGVAIEAIYLTPRVCDTFPLR